MPDLRQICIKHGLDAFATEFAMHLGQQVAETYEHVLMHPTIKDTIKRGGKKMDLNAVLQASMEIALEATKQYTRNQ